MCTPNLKDSANSHAIPQETPPTPQMPLSIPTPPPDYGNRPDGTKKGVGYLGVLARPDGNVSTELTVGVNFDDKEQDIPLIVPTLNKEELKYLLETQEDSPDFFKKMPSSIMDKAVDHARSRQKQGKSVYAD
jgi:hypothetical protein